MDINRRAFNRSLAFSLAATAGAPLVPPASAATPVKHYGVSKNSDVQAALDALVTWPVIGAVCTVTGTSGLRELASGRRSSALPAPARPHSVARIASVTKTMTATVAFQEIERGALRLDSTIGEVLPNLWPGRETVTLEQLLNHTSGMPDAVGPLMEHRPMWDLPLSHVRDVIARPYATNELVEIARQEPWWFDPGTDWGYSNTGYMVIQLMIEAVTGRPLSRLIRDRVFKPARMHRGRLEEGTLVRGAEMEETAMRPGETMRLRTVDQSIFAGAAAVIATAGDVVRFYQALMRGRLVSQSSVNTMITPVGAARQALYGYGIFTVPDPAHPEKSLYGHDGSGFGSTSLALTSRDGARAMALTYIGRPYWGEGSAQVWDRQAEVIDAAFAQSGNTHMDTPSPGVTAMGGGRIG